MNFFPVKEFGNQQNGKKRIKTNKEETLKKVKESIMWEEIVNNDIEKTVSVKSLEEAVEAVKNMEKVIKSNKYNILWLAYQQNQISEKFKIYHG